jgi:adenylosuccinate lyase
MIDRYSLPVMKNIWEEKNKYKTWLKIELLVCEALFELGNIGQEAIEMIRKITALFFIAILFTSCGNKQFTIKGELEGAEPGSYI